MNYIVKMRPDNTWSCQIKQRLCDIQVQKQCKKMYPKLKCNMNLPIFI
jgi:hypothetical protein